MTASQASHLIEQFASQCPLAIWILDPRGVAIFANKKLHEMLEIDESPSSAVGMNILEEPAVKTLHLEKEVDRLMEGKSISFTITLEEPHTLSKDILIGRKEPLVLRVVAYALLSSTQTIEHFVLFLEDATETREHHAKLKDQTHDIQTFMRSKESRKEGLESLKIKADELRESIRALGGEPEL